MGRNVRYKVHLVAKGFSQAYKLDFDVTFVPVARLASFRLLVAIANQFELSMHHMDVTTAFLNGTLTENIYMEVPEGISHEPGSVCKLNKTLYGLKQASRGWFTKFDSVITGLGFRSVESDYCLYVKYDENSDNIIFLLIYVDDLIIVCKNYTLLQEVKKYLSNVFKMVDLGPLKHFLGIKVDRTENTISLSQSVFLESILSRFRMTDCHPCKTPLEVGLDYEKLNVDDFNCTKPCRSAIGCLMYAMLCTRPDLCATISILSRFQSKNNEELWNHIKCVLRYIKGTINLKLTYRRNPFKLFLSGFVDADWGSVTTDRQSTSGYIFRLFDTCTITWSSTKQKCVAISSTESEYVALAEGVKEVLWLISILKQMCFQIKLPINIYEDNAGCIGISKNPTGHKRVKHIDIKYHFIRFQIKSGIINVEPIPTENQLADIFTKPLATQSFERFRSLLGLM